MPGPEQFGLIKLKGILYGDDNWGTVLDEEPPHKNKKGIEMKRYLIIPGEHLIKQYPQLQKPGTLTYKGYALWVEYPTYWVDDRNPSRTNAIARIDCGYDGRATTQTRRNKRYTDEIKMLQEELENVNLSNMHRTEENKMLLGEIKELIKDMVEIANLFRGGKNETGEEYEQGEK